MLRRFSVCLLSLAFWACSPNPQMNLVIPAANEYVTAGMEAYEKGDMVAAEQAYRDAIRISPENPEGFLGLGAVLAQGGKDSEAAEAFEQAIALDSTSSRAHAGLGVTRLGLGDINGGLEALEKAVALDGDNSTARFGLALAYLALGQRDKALEQAKHLEKNDPKLAKELRGQIVLE